MPRKPTGITRDRQYQMRWKDDEFREALAKAKAKGMKVAAYLRSLVEKDKRRR